MYKVKNKRTSQAKNIVGTPGGFWIITIDVVIFVRKKRVNGTTRHNHNNLKNRENIEGKELRKEGGVGIRTILQQGI